MVKYILKRLLVSIATIWVVITMTFFMMHAIPGGPFTEDHKLPASVEANLKAKFGLDKPIGAQYTTYLTNLVHGYLGPSMMSEGRSVNEVIAYAFPTSAKLGIYALAFAILVGMSMGIMAAIKQGTFFDNLCMILSTAGVVVPNFVIATVFIYFFAVKFAWFPAVGFDGPANYVLPTVALGSYIMAFVARLVRSSLIDVLSQDYIKVARAKGLSKSTIIMKHALKNSLIPVVTFLGPMTAAVLTGSFVIESIFGIPGIGREFVTSISSRDYTTTLGVTVLLCVILVSANFVVDILYVLIDPRIKLES